MMNEETRKVIEVLQKQIDLYGQEYDAEGIEALNKAIKMLEQQPCEDCISREQTLKAFAEKCGGECACCEYNGSGYDNAENCKLIKSMTSVTPSRPRGKWIKAETEGRFYCSICGGIHNDTESGEWREVFDFKYPYCPNCGADLRESEDEDESRRNKRG